MKMGKIFKILGFIAKNAIVAGSIQLTIDHGVWGSPDETEQLYNQLYENIPGLKTFREDYIGDLIPKSATNFNFRDSWNSGVLTTFSFIADSPAKACALKDYAIQSISTLIEEQTPKEQKET